MLVPSRFADLGRRPARVMLGAIGLLGLLGLAASVLTRPSAPSPAKQAGDIAGMVGGMAAPPGPIGLLAIARPPSSPDLDAYQEIVRRVRQGENYHDVAGQVLPGYGFQTGSMFNWRLPTYAYVLALFPGKAWIQAALTLLVLAALVLTFIGERRDLPPAPALVTPVLLIGVARWIFDGDACYAQEVWAALLLMLSLAAAGVERRGLAVVAGLAALAFRELVLPYCGLALVFAFWHGRRIEGIAWLAGILLFAVFLTWHGLEVRQRIAADTVPGSALDWLRLGQPDYFAATVRFILSTIKMNAWLRLPAWLQWLYLWIALVGLIGWRSERGLLLSLTTLSYLSAFALVGLPYNLYWGLMTAPLLCFGPVRAPRAISDLLQATGSSRTNDEGPMTKE